MFLVSVNRRIFFLKKKKLAPLLVKINQRRFQFLTKAPIFVPYPESTIDELMGMLKK